jgi:hypothetical protein
MSIINLRRKRMKKNVKKEIPIAILTVNTDISKMKSKQRIKLIQWLESAVSEIEYKHEHYGKCRWRLW